MDKKVKAHTQTAAVLECFIKRKTWTRWDIERETGSSYPPARIYDLRKKGIVFASDFQSGKNRFGRKYASRVWTIVTPKDKAIQLLATLNRGKIPVNAKG